ncbi:MAG: hypothetical protein HQK93_01265, partial [Nitrospirae bacterium]|nr:hypothetical protein [Nitrospirota bacterium]
NVVLFLPPYHPSSYHSFFTNKPACNNCKVIDEVEVYLNNLAKKRNIKLVGSYNPNKYNLLGLDFIDYRHGQQSSLNKIFLNNPYIIHTKD